MQVPGGGTGLRSQHTGDWTEPTQGDDGAIQVHGSAGLPPWVLSSVSHQTLLGAVGGALHQTSGAVGSKRTRMSTSLKCEHIGALWNRWPLEGAGSLPGSIPESGKLTCLVPGGNTTQNAPSRMK